MADRYIADRFLPDKAIDLVDEAAAKLKMEITSKPLRLDEIDRRVLQLEMERLSLSKVCCMLLLVVAMGCSLIGWPTIACFGGYIGPRVIEQLADGWQMAIACLQTAAKHSYVPCDSEIFICSSNGTH